MGQNNGKGPGQRGTMLPRYKSAAKKGEEYLRSRGFPSSRRIIRDHHAAQRRAVAAPEEETPATLDALPDDVLLVMLD